MTKTGVIKFYFDFCSPYAYFSIDKIEQIASNYQHKVDWYPIMLGVIIKKTGNQALRHQPLKGNYSLMDWERLGRFLNLPWKLPKQFPCSTLIAARSFYWVKDQDSIIAEKFAKKLMLSYFGEGRDISKIDTVVQIAVSTGIDQNQLLSALDSKKVKTRLKYETENAMNMGVFGSPFFFINGEPFWGSDRLWMIKRWLKLGSW